MKYIVHYLYYHTQYGDGTDNRRYFSSRAACVKGTGKSVPEKDSVRVWIDEITCADCIQTEEFKQDQIRWEIGFEGHPSTIEWLTFLRERDE